MLDDSTKNEEFSPEIRAVFDDYHTPRPSRGFDERFWAQLEGRQRSYRGFSGLMRRVWELEIEGVLVWRLALSTLSGGASCALIFACALGFSTSPTAPVPRPTQSEFPTSAMTAFAFSYRDWESDYFLKPTPKTAPPRAPKNGGGFSWNGSNAPLA